MVVNDGRQTRLELGDSTAGQLRANPLVQVATRGDLRPSDLVDQRRPEMSPRPDRVVTKNPPRHAAVRSSPASNGSSRAAEP
jgi:hypothetical protein